MQSEEMISILRDIRNELQDIKSEAEKSNRIVFDHFNSFVITSWVVRWFLVIYAAVKVLDFFGKA
jgi:hypothetical protein